MGNGIDRVIVNARIRTLDEGQPTATALALSGDRIVAVGNDDDIRALASAGTTIDNLEGRSILPGFVDAHLHWRGTSESRLEIELYDLKSSSVAVERVAERVKMTPKGEWISGYGWSQGTWDDPSFPTAQDLDAVSPDHPVVLRARSGHATWVNSLAMRIAGIDASTVDPVGGQLTRDEQGNPTGILLEWTAMDLVTAHIPPATLESIVRKMALAQDVALTLGMTGIHDFDWRESFQALQVLRERRELSLRVIKQINRDYFNSMIDLGLRQGFGDDWIRIGNLKIFADGALGPRTAAMIDPYEGEPENYGVVVTDKEDTFEMVSRASAAGVASSVHAIGDRAVHDLLDVYEAVRKQEAARGETPDQRRHRIEHVQLIHPSDVNRLAELKLIASMQPIHATSDMPFAELYWGERNAYSYNPKLQLDRGVVVAFGSDSPVEAMGPIAGIHAAVTRRRPDGSPGPDGWYPEARISIDQAVRGYTTGPAYAGGTDDHIGMLKAGYLADIVVLDHDLYETAPDDLLGVKVMGTMVGGQWKYRNF